MLRIYLGRPGARRETLEKYVRRLEELESLAKALDAAIRPFIGLTRNDPPESAQPVHLDFKAFLRPEALT